MGRIVVTEFSSLDGVVEGPGGEEFRHRSWAFEFDRGEDGEQFKVDEGLAAEALLIGRKTYESFAGAWPNYDGPLADKYNSMPKYVVSSTLQRPEWPNTQVISGDVREAAARLRKELAGEIQVPGSIRLAQELLAADLVDEIRLMIFPVVLGTGRRLFGEAPDKTAWRLAETRTFGDGVLLTVHQRATNR